MTDYFAEKSRDWDERPVPAQISQAVGRLLETLDWDKTPPGPELPDEIIARTAEKYREAEARLTGR